MRSRISVEPYYSGRDRSLLCDMFVATVGYETRARYIAANVPIEAPTRLALGFPEQHVHDYFDNEVWFASMGFEMAEVSDVNYLERCRQSLRKLSTQVSSERPVHVVIDVSSMSRLRIAAWIASLFEVSIDRLFKVDILYASALYSEPSHESGPIVTSRPVLESFAGWSMTPESQPVVIFGLGYEQDKAVGALEYLEPGVVWAFTPKGEDARYEDAMRAANETLWDLIPSSNIVEYPVLDPFATFLQVESVSFGAMKAGRPVIIPFGPKIFSVCSLLAACLHYPAIAVWRVSSGALEPPNNRIASGSVVGITAMFDSVALATTLIQTLIH